MKKYSLFDSKAVMKRMFPFLFFYSVVAAYLLVHKQQVVVMIVSIVTSLFMLYQFIPARKWIRIRPLGIQFHTLDGTTEIGWNQVTKVLVHPTEGIQVFIQRPMTEMEEVITLPMYMKDYQHVVRVLHQECSARSIFFR